MNKALLLVRLDLITIKPYLTIKNMLIFALVALMLLLNSGNGMTAVAMIMVYAAMFVSYPFAVGDKNGIDALYTTLSIRRKTVVLGRYLFALAIDVCAGLAAYCFGIAVLSVMGKDFDARELLLSTIVVLLLYSIIQAVQLPLFFKLGYARAKLLAYLPLIGAGALMAAAANIFSRYVPLKQVEEALGWFAANPPLTVLLAAILWLGIMVASYATACSHYQKRDF